MAREILVAELGAQVLRVCEYRRWILAYVQEEGYVEEAVKNCIS